MDEPVHPRTGAALAWSPGQNASLILAGPSGSDGRTWTLQHPDSPSVISISQRFLTDWTEVDRIADITAAWLDADWSVR